MVLKAAPYDAQIRIPPPPARERICRGLAAPTATFEVTYHDFPAAAQTAFQAAMDIWASLLVSPITIRVDARWTDISPHLGNAGPAHYVQNRPGMPQGYWFPIALANKFAGQDLTPGKPHITGDFNSAIGNWYFGTDGLCPAQHYDLVTVVLHELCHGFGFTYSYNVNNSDPQHPTGSWGSQFNPRHPKWTDLFVRFGWETGSEGPSDYYLTNSNRVQNDSELMFRDLTSGNIHHFSIEGAAANGGRNPKLYAPAVWEPGASINHLDPAAFPPADPNALMTPAVGTSEAHHNPGPVVLGILHSYGWAHNSPVGGLRTPPEGRIKET